METLWRIELLGGLKAVQAGQVIDRFRYQRTGSLLAYLAFYRGRPHPREELVELLWPECEPKAGRLRLRVTLSSLRRQLEPPGVPPGAVVIATASTVQLSLAGSSTDVARFNDCLRAAARAASATDEIEQLTEAVQLYRGELVPGSVEAWVLPERERLAEAFLQAVSRLVTLLAQAGDLPRALQYARQAVAVDPLREEAHQAVIRLLAAHGQPEAALRQYRELERLLARELGTEPPRELRALVEAMAARGTTDRKPPLPVTTRSSAPERLPPSPLPTGTVTFLLVDLPGPGDGSETQAPGSPGSVMPGTTADRPSGNSRRAGRVDLTGWESCRELLRPLLRGSGGHELPGTGERLRMAFGRASEALTAAVAGQRALAGNPASRGEGSSLARPHYPTPRMAVRTGEVEPGDDTTCSPALQKTERLLVAGHPGQILVSEVTAGLLRSALAAELRLVDLGCFRLHAAGPAEHLYQVEDLSLAPRAFPPLNAPRARTGSLPPPLTRLFGREAELARLQELLLPAKTADGKRETGDPPPLRGGAGRQTDPANGISPNRPLPGLPTTVCRLPPPG